MARTNNKPTYGTGRKKRDIMGNMAPTEIEKPVLLMLLIYPVL